MKKRIGALLLVGAIGGGSLGGMYAARGIEVSYARPTALNRAAEIRMVNHLQNGARPRVPTRKVSFTVGEIQQLIAENQLRSDDEIDFVLGAYDPASAREAARQSGLPEAELVGKITLVMHARARMVELRDRAEEMFAVGNPTPPRHD